MRVFIVDPSPLARNVYRLLLHRIATCKISEVDNAEAIDWTDAARPPYDLLILGGRAFEGDRGKLRTMLTDVAGWQRLPKLIVALAARTGRKPLWDGLARTTLLQRPFSPEDFVQAVKMCIKGSGGSERRTTNDCS